MFDSYKDKKSVKDFTFNDSFSLLDIYNFLNENLSHIKDTLLTQNSYKNESFNLTIYKISNERFILLKICGKLEQIIYPYLKIKYFSNGNYSEYDLFSNNQFISLAKELNNQYPEIIYIKGNEEFKNNYDFDSYINLYNQNFDNIYIKEKNYLKIMSAEDFNKLNKKKKCKFFEEDFKTPEEFDKNFYKYFPLKHKYEYKSFRIFETESRKKIADDFLCLNCGVIKKYFGQPSMGKSITLIGSLKYIAPHEFYGTMYINCKALDYFFKNDIITAKQILIDEILYLFYNEYENYKLCSENIENYQVDRNNINESFWNLIGIIISFLKNLKNKYYIISFDQYKEEIDPLNKIEEFFKDIRYKNILNIALITLSSLNNSDIGEYKLNSLFPELNTNNHIIYKEIKNLIDDKDLVIEEKDIDNKLKYIGRNVHNFNIITTLIDNNQAKSIDNYVDERKNHIMKRIYDYFGIDRNIKIANSQNLYKFLSFSVYTKYTFLEFKNILKNVPIKYFVINKKKSKKNKLDYIQLEYIYPVIQDIIEEIYSFIILRKDFSSIINENMDGGCKGIFFEKLVIHYFTPGEHNDNEVNFFEEFNIENLYTIPKFIPKKKEKMKLNNEKLEISNKPFVLKQKMFGGKGLDIVIVQLYENNQADFFCFQITKYKKKKDLFTDSKLKKNLNIMVEYMKNFFDFEISTIYFSYIFDFKKINEKKIKKMCQNCDEENIKYIFYDSDNSSFYDKNSYNVNIRRDFNVFNLNNKPKIEVSKFKLTKNQKEEIKRIFGKIYKQQIEINYFGTNDLNIMRMKKKNFFCITQYAFKDQNNKVCPEIVMYFYNNNNYNCHLLYKNGGSKKLDGILNTFFLFQSEFDYYKIIID